MLSSFGSSIFHHSIISQSSLLPPTALSNIIFFPFRFSFLFTSFQTCPTFYKILKCSSFLFSISLSVQHPSFLFPSFLPSFLRNIFKHFLKHSYSFSQHPVLPYSNLLPFKPFANISSLPCFYPSPPLLPLILLHSQTFSSSSLFPEH